MIEQCEKLADCDAEVRKVPVWLLKGTRSTLRSFQWATDAADRLAFAEVLSSIESFSADMEETYRVLGVDPASITTLEAYLKVGGCAPCGPACLPCLLVTACCLPGPSCPDLPLSAAAWLCP